MVQIFSVLSGLYLLLFFWYFYYKSFLCLDFPKVLGIPEVRVSVLLTTCRGDIIMLVKVKEGKINP